MAFIFVFGALIEEIVSLFLASNGIHNLWVSQAYDVFEYICLILMFSEWLKRSVFRSWLRWTIPVYALFWICAKLTFEPLEAATQYTHSVSAVVVSMLAAFLLVELVREDHPSLTADMRFWISVAVLTYFCGNVFLFIYFDKFAGLQLQAALSVWTLHWGLGIVTNILFTIAFLCNRTR